MRFASWNLSSCGKEGTRRCVDLLRGLDRNVITLQKVLRCAWEMINASYGASGYLAWHHVGGKRATGSWASRERGEAKWRLPTGCNHDQAQPSPRVSH